MTHFRTFTVVAEVEDGSPMSYPGVALDAVIERFEALGFGHVRARNEPNPTGEMPARFDERRQA